MLIAPESPEALARALDVIENGGCVVHATETCYGITCDLSNPAALKHLFAVKRRPAGQPVSVLFPSMESALQYGLFSAEALRLAGLHLPGPLTIVVPVHPAAPKQIYVTAGGQAPLLIGVRVSSHPLATHLAESYGAPIATTSANLHGKSNPYSAQDIQDQWKGLADAPDILIDSGSLPVAKPSTVVQVVGNNITVIRQGDLIIA